jgi:hypothetical protein
MALAGLAVAWAVVHAAVDRAPIRARVREKAAALLAARLPSAVLGDEVSIDWLFRVGGPCHPADARPRQVGVETVRSGWPGFRSSAPARAGVGAALPRPRPGGRRGSSAGGRLRRPPRARRPPAGRAAPDRCSTCAASPWRCRSATGRAGGPFDLRLGRPVSSAGRRSTSASGGGHAAVTRRALASGPGATARRRRPKDPPAPSRRRRRARGPSIGPAAEPSPAAPAPHRPPGATAADLPAAARPGRQATAAPCGGGGRRDRRRRPRHAPRQAGRAGARRPEPSARLAGQ